MKIKFRKLDGVITGFGFVETLHPSADEGEENFNGVLPDKDLPWKRIAPGQVEKISQAEKDAIQAKEEDEKTQRKSRKKQLMTKLGITKQDLLALLELIKDGTDD